MKAGASEGHVLFHDHSHTTLLLVCVSTTTVYRSEVVVLEVLKLFVYLIADVLLTSWNINTGIYNYTTLLYSQHVAMMCRIFTSSFDAVQSSAWTFSCTVDVYCH